MSDRWCTRDGWAVEVIHMTATPDGHDGESFRITHHGYWIGYARSVPELERWIDLADLEDPLTLALGWRPQADLEPTARYPDLHGYSQQASTITRRPPTFE